MVWPSCSIVVTARPGTEDTWDDAKLMAVIELMPALALPSAEAEVIRSYLSKDESEVFRGSDRDLRAHGDRAENVDKLRALAADACKVAANEPGTLTFRLWHYSEEHGSVVLLETYANSSAHLAHMGAEGHGELMGSLMALIGSLEFFVLAEPTAEHAEALAAVPGAQFYSELVGESPRVSRARRDGH